MAGEGGLLRVGVVGVPLLYRGVYDMFVVRQRMDNL